MLNSRLILLILVLSAFALWFNVQQEDQDDALTPSTLQTTDYSWQLFNSTTWQFNKDNNLNSAIIQSETLFYDEAAKTSDFTLPQLTLIEPNQTLFIESQAGRSSDNQIFELSGKVIMTQLEHPLDKPQTDSASQNKTLKTEHITYNSITKKISSDQAVSITQPNSHFTGIGLDVDLTTRHFQLLSDVKGEYHPQMDAD
ncbi:MAG: LPS export ABC transporter periplasmic protein LptC [Thiotrichales bacterium]|nr:LPS export ABC transporter periplasmic protein LptC [Thiotrichales bacterium]